MPEAIDKKEKVSVIIAAYNEEPRIGAVLKVVEKHPLVGEVIVVDDGSTDKTVEVVGKYKVNLIRNKVNLGKTLSVKKGLEYAKNEVVLLLDADLVGLTQKNVTDLVTPVLNGKVDWTLSVRGNSLGYMKLLNMDWISGERAIRKELLADPLIWSQPKIGFGLETLMNKSLLERNKTFCSVPMLNCRVTTKAEKIGNLRGYTGDFMMINEITKIVPIYTVLGQFFKMAYLSNKYRKSVRV